MTRRITVTRRVTVRTTFVPIIRANPLPPRPKRPVTIRVCNGYKTIWV